MEEMDAKRLRDQLMEYEGYLGDMRQVTRKNVETLDVIQRYTDKSAAGMQKLAEQSLEGVQRVTAESAGGLRRMIETGTSNLVRTAEDGGENLRRVAEASEEGIRHTAQACLQQLQQFSETSAAQIASSYEKNMETAAQVEKIEGMILEHLEAMKDLLRQSDDFTHRENVKVYRNVQAVVVDEVKKQTEAMAMQNEALTAQNASLQKQNKGVRPLMVVTLLAALINIGLVVMQIAGLL